MRLPGWLPLVGAAVGILTLIGAVYGVFTRAGYIVSEARAQEIAKQEVLPEERARLEFIREMKFSRLRLLNALEQPTADDRLEMETLRSDIQRISDRLEQLK